MSNKVLKEMIGNLDQAELEKLSLAETLSVEEAVCDTASAAFLVETASFLGEATADMPMNPADVAAALRNNDDFDKYQRFNQNNISGIDDEDLHDMTDPDQRGGDGKGDAQQHGAGNTEKDHLAADAGVDAGGGHADHDGVVASQNDIDENDLRQRGQLHRDKISG